MTALLLFLLTVLYVAGLVCIFHQPSNHRDERGPARRYTSWDPELGITWQVEKWQPVAAAPVVSIDVPADAPVSLRKVA